MFLVLYRASVVQKHGRIFLFASLLTVCMMTILFFVSGRVSMLPLPEGVHEMTKYGCCAQAIVYPGNKVPMYVRRYYIHFQMIGEYNLLTQYYSLAKWYEEHRIGFVDTLAEELGDERPDEIGVRWALTPSVVQHVGGKSSMTAIYSRRRFTDSRTYRQRRCAMGWRCRTRQWQNSQ